MITLYGISNCDTIKKTRALLSALEIEYKFHDYKKLGAHEALIQTFLQHFDIEALINKRGTTWRKLPDDVKQSLTEATAIELMSENSSLIKRPIIDSGSEWLIGFDEEKIQSLAKD